jgi:hypothetical protein
MILSFRPPGFSHLPTVADLALWADTQGGGHAGPPLQMGCGWCSPAPRCRSDRSAPTDGVRLRCVRPFALFAVPCFSQFHRGCFYRANRRWAFPVKHPPAPLCLIENKDHAATHSPLQGRESRQARSTTRFGSSRRKTERAGNRKAEFPCKTALRVSKKDSIGEKNRSPIPLGHCEDESARPPCPLRICAERTVHGQPG